jgi:hypothetical protein
MTLGLQLGWVGWGKGKKGKKSTPLSGRLGHAT